MHKKIIITIVTILIILIGITDFAIFQKNWHEGEIVPVADEVDVEYEVISTENTIVNEADLYVAKMVVAPFFEMIENAQDDATGAKIEQEKEIKDKDRNVSEWEEYFINKYDLNFFYITNCTINKNYAVTDCSYERKYEIVCEEMKDPMLTAIYFWTEESTKKCMSNDKDLPHQELFGITYEKFLKQKESYVNKGIFEDVAPIKIEDQFYYVTKSPCEDGCGLNYVTYFGDIRILLNFRTDVKNDVMRDENFWNNFQQLTDNEIKKMNISIN